MNKVKAWFRFAKRAWISLGLGWIAPVVGLLNVFRLDQAGALLVCSAIVAEVFHDKRHRLFVYQIQPGIARWHMYREVDVPGEVRKDIEITSHQARSGKTTVNTSSWALYQLALPEEFSQDRDSRLWDLERTMKRVERRVDYAIVLTAIAGTVLWAFG